MHIAELGPLSTESSFQENELTEKVKRKRRVKKSVSKEVPVTISNVSLSKKRFDLVYGRIATR